MWISYRLQATSYKLEFGGWSRNAGAPWSNKQFEPGKGFEAFYGEGEI